MMQIKEQFIKLKDQLVNPGEETDRDEVMWNDTILIAIDELFENAHEDIEKLIRLNLI